MLSNPKTKSVVVVILFLSTATFGAEPVSISHSITSCTVDGPTATLNLTLEIVNNTTTVLFGAEITTAPMGPLEKRLGLIFEQAATQVGDNALDDVNTNNDAAAINTLEAFISAVEAQRGKEISETDTDGLIQVAVNIINMSSGP